MKLPFLRAFLFLLGLTTTAAQLSGCPTPGPTPTKPTAAFSATPTSGASPLVVQFTDQSTAGTSAITTWAWNFGDGETSTAEDPSHTYDADGTYTVALTVTSADGSDTETKTGLISVGSDIEVPPTANFTANLTTGAAPLAVQFTDTSIAGSSPITAWVWEFGDGETSTDQNPSHTYADAGTFSVSLSVTTADGEDTEVKTGLIEVTDGEVIETPPAADFTATPTSGNAPLTVQFTDASAAGSSAITTWAWEFGDGETSTAQNPSHTFTDVGTYSATLSVTTADGSDSETKTNLITVNAVASDTPPTADFTATPTSGDVPLAVQFTDTSAAGSSAITTWAWEFGDGETSTAQNPSHTFTDVGTYSVTLGVTTADGSDTKTKTNFITVNAVASDTPPTADFTATPTSGDAPLAVQFVDTSASGSSVITEWAWDFGDDETSAERNPAHTYTDAGTYSVTLTVTTADGSDEEFKANLIAVTSGSGTAPTAAFSATPVSGDAPLTVDFADESTAGTSPITTWSWDFGDGATGEGASPTHIYSAVGTYTVSLTVTTLDGTDIETKTDLIDVENEAEFAESVSAVEADLVPDVSTVAEAELADVIIQWNPEEHAYLLDPEALVNLGITLEVGKPLILDGVEVGRVSYVETDETGTYIETEELPLNELYPNGTISWDYGVQFTADTVKSIEIPGVGEYFVQKDTPINITFEQGEFKYELAVVLKKTTADFDFTVTKGVGAGVKARFTAKGQFEQFRNKNQIEFESGQLTNFGHELKGLRGNTDLKLIMAGSGMDSIDFKIPVPILKIPFVVGYIPATLSVGAQFVVNAAVPIEGSAQVGTSFKYDSDLGFSFNGTEVLAGGRAGTTTFGDPLHMTGAASAISANFGVGFPRVTLSIAGGTLVPWAQVAFLVGGAYTPGINPCQSADALFQGSAGYNLGILGFELASGSKKLFEHKKPLLRAGICPPDNKVFLQDETAAWLSGEGAIVLDRPVLVEYE